MGKHKTPQELLAGFDVAAFQAILFQSDDWPTVIMTGQLLDTFLELAISLFFENTLEAKDKAEIFSGYGPLSTASSKIMIGYAMGVISKEVRDDLRVMKSVRNEAAHRIKDFRFDEIEIARLCNKFHLIDPIPAEFLDKSPLAKAACDKIGFFSPRARFSLSACRSFMHITAMIKDHAAKHLLLKLIRNVGEAVKNQDAHKRIMDFYDTLGIPHNLHEYSTKK